MSEVPDAAIENHPAFIVYDDFFYDAANDVCRGCPRLTGVTNRYALEALRNVIRPDRSGQGIEDIDIIREQEVLEAAYHRFRKEVGSCQGPKLTDADPTEIAERISSFHFFTPEFRAKTIARLLPLREVCGLDTVAGEKHPKTA